MIFSDGPFIRIFGIGENEVIAQTIGRGRSVNVTAIYNRVFVYNRNFLFILSLQAGHDYIVRLEGGEGVASAAKIDMTTGIIQAIQPGNFWD